MDERLDKIAALEPNWDSYGALPISPQAVAEARRLLSYWPGDHPWPVPRTDGTVALEFDNDDVIIIETDGSVRWETD